MIERPDLTATVEKLVADPTTKPERASAMIDALGRYKRFPSAASYDDLYNVVHASDEPVPTTGTPPLAEIEPAVLRDGWKL